MDQGVCTVPAVCHAMLTKPLSNYINQTRLTHNDSSQYPTTQDNKHHTLYDTYEYCVENKNESPAQIGLVGDNHTML